MRPMLVVMSVVSVLSFGISCSGASPSTDTSSPAAAATTPVVPAQTPTAVESPSQQSGQWRVVRKKNPMNDADTFVASSRVKGDEGTYELQFSLENENGTVEYTMYDAEPLGLVPTVEGTTVSFHKNLRWRFDKQEPNIVVATQNKEYANRFTLDTMDDAFARLGATSVRTTWSALTTAKAVVIQGLRDPGEYIEFPLDESFAPFRTIVAGTIAARAGGATATSSDVTGSISKDNVFLLNGRPTDPEVEGELGLTIEKQIQFKNGYAFLLKNKGGTQCPTSYYWVFKDASRTKVTPEFGTCALLSDVSEKDGLLVGTMPSTPPTTYTFDGLTLLENGKPVKD